MQSTTTTRNLTNIEAAAVKLGNLGAVDLLLDRYADRGNSPLTVREIQALFGTRWTRDAQQAARFDRHFVICRDGVVRTR